MRKAYVMTSQLEKLFLPYLFLHPPLSTNIQLHYCFTMPPKSSKKSSTVPNSPPNPRRSGRKCTRSSLDATVAPPSKKLAMENEEGEIEGEDGSNEDGTTGVKEKRIKYEK